MKRRRDKNKKETEDRIRKLLRKAVDRRNDNVHQETQAILEELTTQAERLGLDY